MSCFKVVTVFFVFQDALQTATAHQQLMEQQVEEVMATLASLNLDHSKEEPVHQVIRVRY